MAREIPPEMLEAMRGHAAQRGAQSLLVERVETPWRKAFYGIGLVRHAEAEPLHVVPPCRGAAFESHLDAVSTRVGRCLRDLKKARPALRGEAAVRMLVDGDGGVYSAGVSPGSSRDGAVRSCLLSETWKGRFGPSSDLLCGAEFAADLP